MVDDPDNNSYSLDLNLLAVRPGDRFTINLPNEKPIELTCVRRAWWEASLAIGETDAISGFLYLAAWFLAFKGENAPPHIEQAFKEIQEPCFGLFFQSLQALGCKMPPTDIVPWPKFIAEAQRAPRDHLESCLDAMTWAFAGPRSDEPKGYLAAFRRISEGRFEYVGDYILFNVGEMSIQAPTKEVELAVIAIEIIDEASRQVRIEPFIFHVYKLDSAGKRSHEMAPRDWIPSQLDKEGLQAEFKRYTERQ